MRVRLTETARLDLHGIQDYLEPRSVQGYTRVTSAIFTTMKQLESFPFLGRAGEVDGTRELTVPATNYRLVYRLNEPYHVDVIRVLHSSLRYPPDAK